MESTNHFYKSKSAKHNFNKLKSTNYICNKLELLIEHFYKYNKVIIKKLQLTNHNLKIFCKIINYQQATTTKKF